MEKHTEGKEKNANFLAGVGTVRRYIVGGGGGGVEFQTKNNKKESFYKKNRKCLFKLK